MQSGELYHEDGQADGDAIDKVGEKRLIVRRLLNRLDISQVAALLEASVDEVTRIAAQDDAGRRLGGCVRLRQPPTVE